MTNPPSLLNDDRSASMATLTMMSHHAFRRDIQRFARALSSGDTTRVPALRREWDFYYKALLGHHQMEDTVIFPNLRQQHAALGATFDQLASQHHQIDPLLERGNRAFAELPSFAGAARVVSELRDLLDVHLALEEREVAPLLRDAKDFPVPPDEEMLNLYAEGFAWSSQGVAPEVLAQVDLMLPAALVSRLPEARAAFQARCDQVWGPLKSLASRTSVPEPE